MISGTAISALAKVPETEDLDIDLAIKHSAIVYSTVDPILALFSEVAGEVTSLDPLTIDSTVISVPLGYTIEVTLGQEVVIDTLLAAVA